MNQDQRKFLIDQVTKTCANQVEALKSKMPKKPSLNNYLVAACLDGSLLMNDIELLRDRIKQAVLNLGPNEALVSEDNSNWRNSNDKHIKQKVTLEAEDIFVFPEAYIKAKEEYMRNKAALEEEINALIAQRDTIIMKIQIGSNNILDKLVLQIDSMGDLNLMNSQLMLGAGN